ncbi:ankyrin repeat domain-containing protein 29 [Folsomia candida]|uniref:Ankyrin repeat domain-containing protein 29 n=1 Tax=Folsomia candida TaxID=158441 RepID=A0A226DHM9_FOLCA|nr:ankyrin repeat domain-containing protein 29 [Folsomia candida]XP_021962779.1 ankyrin repeat domain-containing protein 29 [Folsomia candida]XP_021962780.1 ankyrin repeat domain-containing protein 29 [Folsomia candida]XP_021962781.1 ankyrin repeat domain-containing protein 29 [Folsomia candida]XP_035714593.1 ankyrin repeat domain-containing protein 29 [Folsomia candida]OXA43686.1 Ankyrin repeat domain-containing protein 29 [Folsomia candida]
MSFKRETPWDIKLHRAAIRGDSDIINHLLNSGRVHVDCRDNDGTTPLMFAVAGCNYNCVQELLEQNADPNAKRFETRTSPLFLAAQNGDIDTLRLLLKYGAELDQPNCDGGTPLFVACQEGHDMMVRELLALGADPNHPMKDRATPLFVAAQNGHCTITRLLLSKGAIVDIRRIDGATPLWISCQMGHATVCSSLLEKGAFVDALRNDGASPLFKAAHKGFRDVVRVLLPYKPKLGFLPNGESALHGAAMFGHLDVIRTLLHAGSDVSLTNRDGNTPYQIALKYKHPHVADYLKSLISSTPKPKPSQGQNL